MAADKPKITFNPLTGNFDIIQDVSELASTSDLTAYQLLAEKGVANGYAPLDGGNKIPSAYIPGGYLTYKGMWNASTNTPTLADGTGLSGSFYEVNVAGTQNLGSGSQTFNVGDWVVYDGSIWDKSTNSNEVVSVNGLTGAVNLTTTNIPEGTNLYFTSSRAKSAAVSDAIVDGITDVAPSQNAVFDALALKASTTLNNLGTTNINNSLLFNTADVYDIGSTTKQAGGVYSANFLSNGTMNITARLSAAMNLIAAQFRFSNSNGVSGASLKIFTGGDAQSVSLSAPTTLAASIDYTLPAAPAVTGYVLSSTTTGAMSWVAQAASGANTALSNLVSTAINADLLPSADLVRNLGSAALRWTSLFVQHIRNATELVIDVSSKTLVSGGNPVFSWRNDGAVVATTKKLAFASSTNEVSFAAAASGVSTQDYTLPLIYPTASGQVLSSTTVGAMSWIAPVGANYTVDLFTGNGATVAYTLSVNPGSENNTMVFISGVYQNKDTYAVSGTTLTFDAAPPNATAIQVVSGSAATINVPADASVTKAKLSASNHVVSSGSSGFTTTSTTAVDVTNLSVTISSSGRPICLTLSGGELASSSTSTNPVSYFEVVRGGTILDTTRVQYNVSAAFSTATIIVPASSLSYFDVPAAGTYTYKIRAYSFTSGTTTSATNAKLVAYEI